MALAVTISERASKNLDEILKYLEVKWSLRVRDKFLDILMAKVQLISENPYIYPSSVIKKSIYRCVLTRQTILYYRVKSDEVEIITIQDARKDLRNLKL